MSLEKQILSGKLERPRRIPTPEETMFEGKENHLFSQDEFKAFLVKNDFHTVRRGTFCTSDKRHFLYAKHGFIFKTREDAEKNLGMIRFLTEKGVVFPGTRWAVTESREGYYQIFGITRGLAVVRGDELPEEGKETLVTWALLQRDGYTESSDQGDVIDAKFKHPNSHLLSWYQRIYPELAADDPNPHEKAPLMHMLNIWEASHSDNWGRDTDGTLYPVDVEVISPEFQQPLVNSWAVEHEAEIPKLTS